MDTIAEQAYIVNNYNAYKEIAEFGLGKFFLETQMSFKIFN